MAHIKPLPRRRDSTQRCTRKATTANGANAPSTVQTQFLHIPYLNRSRVAPVDANPCSWLSHNSEVLRLHAESSR